MNLTSSAPHLKNPATYEGPFKDWGVIPTMIEGRIAHQRRGDLQGPQWPKRKRHLDLHAGLLELPCDQRRVLPLPAGPLHLPHESGEVIEIVPDTVAFLPEGLARHLQGA